MFICWCGITFVDTYHTSQRPDLFSFVLMINFWMSLLGNALDCSIRVAVIYLRYLELGKLLWSGSDFESNRDLCMDQFFVIWVRMWTISDLFGSYLIGNSFGNFWKYLGIVGDGHWISCIRSDILKHILSICNELSALPWTRIKSGEGNFNWKNAQGY